MQPIISFRVVETLTLLVRLSLESRFVYTVETMANIAETGSVCKKLEVIMTEILKTYYYCIE